MDSPPINFDNRTVRAALGVAISAGVPVILWGPPGEGKSRTVEAVAAALGRHSETVIGSIREASDFTGLPERSVDGVVLHAPRWAHRCAHADRAVLFLDELTTCSPPVQAAMLRVVLDREVGDLRLPGTVSIVAAANPPDLAADGYDLSPPLANRFCHLWFQADLREWSSGLLDGWATAAAMPEVPASQECRLAWKRSVADFLRARPSLFRQPDLDLQTGAGPWPSPRSWEMAAVLGASADAVNADDDVVLALTIGAVGAGAGIEFAAFRAHRAVVDCEELLADPTARIPATLEPDQVHAALEALSVVVASRSDDADAETVWGRAVEVALAAAEDHGDDVAAVAVGPLIRQRQPGWVLPEGLRRFAAVLRSLSS